MSSFEDLSLIELYEQLNGEGQEALLKTALAFSLSGIYRRTAAEPPHIAKVKAELMELYTDTERISLDDEGATNNGK